MAEIVKLRISQAVAVFVKPGVSSADKLRGIDASVEMSALDGVTLLFCLMRDQDPAVKAAAAEAFKMVSDDVLLACVALADLHPSILDTMVRLHGSRPDLAAAFLENPSISAPAAAYLQGILLRAQPVVIDSVDEGDSRAEGNDDESDAADDDADSGADSEAFEREPNEDDEEYLSKYQMIQVMGISEKIKMALTGDKEWRSILINDNNKLVSGSVVKNPRITDGEILKILKVGVQNDEIIRLICENKEWIKNITIRKALVDCPKTPLAYSLRFLSSLNDKDIAGYAKSKNVSSVISTQAKRIIMAKKR